MTRTEVGTKRKIAWLASLSLPRVVACGNQGSPLLDFFGSVVRPLKLAKIAADIFQ